MTGVVFVDTLRRNWRTALYWTIGIALLGVYALVVIPNVDMLKQYSDLMKSLPPVLLQAFGLEQGADTATPEGFLGLAFFGYIMFVLAAYGVISGLNVTANEEDRGILDITLSLPIPRWRLVLERVLAYTVIIVAMLTLTFLAMWAAQQSMSGINIDMGRLAEGVFNIVPSTLLVLTFTVCAATVLRSRAAAAGVAAGFVIVSYFIDFVGKAASESAANTLRAISFFKYYNGGSIMTTGLEWGSVLLLLAIAVVLVAGALWFFERRDIGV